MRFVLGLLLGIALGVAAGLILAPQPGSETRKALREQLQKNRETPATAPESPAGPETEPEG